MRNINKVIVHCSDTYPDMDIGAEDIRLWHVEERGWDDIGYHYVIRRCGRVEKGREESVSGAHAKGHNENSIGVCMVGGKAQGPVHPVNFTRSQWRALDALVTRLQNDYPGIDVIGHSDVSKKPCPMFDVKEWWGK